MGTWRTYEKVAPALSTHFEVFAVDVPGHGSSSWLTGAYSWDSVGRYLGDFLEQVVTRLAVIAGNSSGGIFALWLAAHRPESVAAIILEDAPVFSAEWPRFRDHDQFVYQGLVHAVEVLEKPDRRLADYFRGQVLPVAPKRVKRMPDWVIDHIIDPGVRRFEQHPPTSLPDSKLGGRHALLVTSSIHFPSSTPTSLAHLSTASSTATSPTQKHYARSHAPSWSCMPTGCV